MPLQKVTKENEVVILAVYLKKQLGNYGTVNYEDMEEVHS